MQHDGPTHVHVLECVLAGFGMQALHLFIHTNVHLKGLNVVLHCQQLPHRDSLHCRPSLSLCSTFASLN